MNQEHKKLQGDIRLACSGGDTRLFLNSTGTGIPMHNIKGALEKIKDKLLKNFPPAQYLKISSMIDAEFKAIPRITYGLCVGGSDLIGYSNGGKFTAIEVKTENDTARPEQVTFIENVKKSGGIAGIAYSVDEAKSIIKGDNSKYGLEQFF